MLWLLAAIPGLFFTSGVAFSFSLIWLPASGALLVASILWAFLAAAWVTFLPSALYRRTLAAMKLAENEAVNRSWARAFDGVSGTYPTPELRLMDDAAPVLLVFKLPLRAPVLVVSSGWLYSHGEEAFRQACKRAVARMQEPGLELWTCGAVMMSALQSGLSRAFSSLVLAPASEHTDGLRLSAVRLALSLPVLPGSPGFVECCGWSRSHPRGAPQSRPSWIGWGAAVPRSQCSTSSCRLMRRQPSGTQENPSCRGFRVIGNSPG